MSSIVHSRRQVPSMPIMCAAIPRSNVTRSPLRRSATMVLLQPSSRRAPRAPGQGWLDIREGRLTTGESGDRRGDVGGVPLPNLGKRRVGQRAAEVSPDSGLVAQILRLAVAPVEPG